MSDLDITEMLSEVQRIINVPKKRYNKHMNYYYRNADDIVTAFKKIQPKGCYLTMTDDPFLVGTTPWMKTRATFVYKNMQISTESSVEVPLKSPGCNESQKSGMSVSYSRKNALTGLFCLDDGDDADEIAANKDESPQTSDVLISNDRALRISELVSTVGADRGKILAHYHVSTFNELTVEAADHLERNLELRKVKGSEYARV